MFGLGWMEMWIIVGLGVMALLFLMSMLARLYRKAGPHEALIVYGFGGTRVVVGHHLAVSHHHASAAETIDDQRLVRPSLAVKAGQHAHQEQQSHDPQSHDDPHFHPAQAEHIASS